MEENSKVFLGEFEPIPLSGDFKFLLADIPDLS
jgi:hypothetical protein